MRGWQAISEFTGLSVEIVQEAAASGDLRFTPLVRRRDAELWRRALACSHLGDHAVDLVPDGN